MEKNFTITKRKKRTYNIVSKKEKRNSEAYNLCDFHIFLVKIKNRGCSSLESPSKGMTF